MSEQQKLLGDLLVKIAKEQGYEDGKVSIIPIEGDGSNFTSSLFTATMSAAGKDTIYLFAKVAAIGEKMREITPIQIFKTETYFYKTLLQKYRKLEEKYMVPELDRLRTPKFYGSNDEFLKEVLVLENIVAKDFQVADRLKSMSSEYALQGVKQLAKFHALSLALAVHYPQDYEVTKKTLEFPESDSLENFLNRMTGSVIEAINENKKELVTNFIKGVLGRKDLIKLIKCTETPMILHGDYRGSNLMYKPHNKDIEIAILDFQTISFGNPVFDLLYFILTGADKKFLDNCYDATIERYYSELTAALDIFKINPFTTYSKEYFERQLLKLLPLNLVLAFCSLLLVTVEADKAPKADKEMSISDLAVTPNDIYKERLNGILDFFIDNGLLS